MSHILITWSYIVTLWNYAAIVKRFGITIGDYYSIFTPSAIKGTLFYVGQETASEVRRLNSTWGKH